MFGDVVEDGGKRADAQGVGPGDGEGVFAVCGGGGETSPTTPSRVGGLRPTTLPHAHDALVGQSPTNLGYWDKL